MNIGIIGAGAIAQFLLQQQSTLYSVKALLVTNKEKYSALAEQYGVTLHTELSTFLREPIELVVEAATIEAVERTLPTVLRQKPAIVISVGAFANETFYDEVLQISTETRHKIYCPAGAIGGLDLLQNAHALGTVEHVSLKTVKPAQSLTDEVLHEAAVIFEGTAREAIARYPKNMNVSIMLALGALSFDNTFVQLIADPHATTNAHTIHIRGTFGEATMTVNNEPLPTNPKTSYLAAMSIIGTLQRIISPIQLA